MIVVVGRDRHDQVLLLGKGKLSPLLNVSFLAWTRHVHVLEWRKPSRDRETRQDHREPRSDEHPGVPCTTLSSLLSSLSTRLSFF